jgi:predicted sulfurtransferase
MMRTIGVLVALALTAAPRVRAERDAGVSPAKRYVASRGAGAPGVQIDAPRITQQAFKKLIAAKNVVIVDTRVEDVFELGHIPGAVKLPLEGRLTWPESYETTVKMLIASKKPVVTYCA